MPTCVRASVRITPVICRHKTSDVPIPRPTSLGSWNRALAPLRGAAAAAWTASLLGGVTAHCRLVPEAAREGAFDRWLRVWSRGLLRTGGVELEVLGNAPARSNKARLIVANHRSALDIPILLHLFGGSIVSRGDLANWPLLGAAARSAQTIFVDRESGTSRLGALRAIREQLARGRTVTVFPEGGAFPGDEIRPFHPGSLAATRGLDVEVLPVGFAYPIGSEFVEDSFLDHAQNLAMRPSTRVVLAVGSPVQCDTTPAKFATFLQEQVQELTQQARARFNRS